MERKTLPGRSDCFGHSTKMHFDDKVASLFIELLEFKNNISSYYKLYSVNKKKPPAKQTEELEQAATFIIDEVDRIKISLDCIRSEMTSFILDGIRSEMTSFINKCRENEAASLVLHEDINAKLIAAAESGNIEAVKLSIKAGADVDTKDEYDDGETALIAATCEGHTEIARLLMKAGADVNARDIYENTALILAACNDNLEIAKLLIRAGADIDAKDEDGETALVWAARYGYIEMVKLLIRSGSDLNDYEKILKFLEKAISNEH